MANWKIAKPIDSGSCRLCGSDDVALWNDTGTEYFWMECSACGATTDEGSAFSAVADFNVGKVMPHSD